MRPARIPIRKTPSGQFSFDVPPRLSPTGKRQRRTFSTKREAELRRRQTLEASRLYGETSRQLTAAEAEDAGKALELLAGEATLLEAAQALVASRDRRARSVPLSQLRSAYLTSREGSDYSDYYRRDIRRAFAVLLEQLGDPLVADITQGQLKEALHRATANKRLRNDTLRRLSPAWKFAVEHGWADANVPGSVSRERVTMRTPRILTSAEAERLLAACTDHRGNESLPDNLRVDCRDAVAAFAVMLFAGVRPEEVARLEWKSLSLADGTVRIPAEASKVRTPRSFEAPPVLLAWLETVPRPRRTGPVVPRDWERKKKAVRAAFGFDRRDADVLRKTFASHHLACFGDVNLTRAIMGHETPDVLFRHYAGHVEKADALRFFHLFPPGHEHRKLRAAS